MWVMQGMDMVWSQRAGRVVVLGALLGCGDKTSESDPGGPGLLDSAVPQADLTACREWLATGSAPEVETGCAATGEDWRALFLAAGGAIFPVGAGRYYGVWLPDGWQPGTPLIYVVHNTEGCAEQLFDIWRSAGQDYGLVLLQYRSAGAADFDDDRTVYDNLSVAHAAVGEHCPVEGSSRVYYGFSRGAARGYGVSVLDTAGMGFLDAYVIDSGVLPGSSLSGYSSGAMADTRYWMWCGSEDVDPTNASRPMCETMREDMAEAVVRLGGSVDALIEEEGGCHGMFFYDCDESCSNCRRRQADSLGESLPQLFSYIDGL